MILDFEYDIEEITMEQIEWHSNIFTFLNSDNILYVPDQHHLI